MLRILTAPVALIYGIVVKIRNLLFDIKVFKSTSFNRATICVGNLTVGGTGKTPHVDYLIRILSSKSKLAVLSRGYKRKTKGFRYVEVNSADVEVGDEPLQLKLKNPGVTVAVDGNRVRGINTLLRDQPDIEVILLDDAFQHRSVKPGYSILLIDYNNLITRDYFLPLGRLRDSVSELYRAECVIITKCPPDIKPEEQEAVIIELKLCSSQTIFFSSLAYGSPQPVFADNDCAINFSKNTRVFTMAGIANPLLFFEHAAREFNVLDKLSFPDHYKYTEKKIKAIFEKFSKSVNEKVIILTTEKDAVRIKGVEKLDKSIKDAFYFIPIEVVMSKDLENQFANQIDSYVRKSKRDNSLHPGED